MSTLAVSHGYDSIEQEFEASIRKAFVEGGADFIRIYDRRERFQIEASLYGEDKGWLSQQLVELDEQSSEWRFRLTEAGREHFGLTAAKETECPTTK